MKLERVYVTCDRFEAWFGEGMGYWIFFSFLSKTLFLLSPIPSKRRSEHVTCHKSQLITIKEDMKAY